MRATERLLIILFSLLMICVSVLIVLLSWNIISSSDLDEFIKAINTNVIFGALATVVAILLLFLSIRIMFVNTKRPAVNAAMIKISDSGSIRVSIETVNTLAIKFARSVENVRDVRINTVLLPDGIDIYIRAALTADAKIPEVSQNIQSTVKTAIEDHTGLLIKNIPVFIDNSVDTSK